MPTREQTVEIAVDAQSIAGTLVTPGTRIPGVLFIHGWGGSQQQYLARAHEVALLGAVCLTFDLRGHVATASHRETVSRRTNLHDALAAYDALAAHPHVDRAAIAVVGSSYGGYLASILTTLRPVQWLALRAPALYIDAGWDLPKLQLHKEHDLRAWRRSVLPTDDNRALRACAAYRGDVLIVQSEHDDIVPPAVVTSYREACVKARSLTYRCIGGADHGLADPASQRAYTALLTQWLGEMLPGARRSAAGAAAAAGAAEQLAAPTTLPEHAPESPAATA